MVNVRDTHVYIAVVEVSIDPNVASFKTYGFKLAVVNPVLFVKDTGSSFKLPPLLTTPKSAVGNTSRRTIRTPKLV